METPHPPSWMLPTGVAFIAAAIVGGGLTAFEVSIPVIDGVAPTVLLALLGLGLIGWPIVAALRPTPEHLYVIAGRSMTVSRATGTLTAPSVSTRRIGGQQTTVQAVCYEMRDGRYVFLDRHGAVVQEIQASKVDSISRKDAE